MALLVYALLVHGVLGGADVILNHELLARLPHKDNAGPEEKLHSAREFIFAAIFLSLAWFEWHGQAVWWIVALFVGEVLVSARDVIVEGDTRVLPVPERVLHLFLFMNLGVIGVLGGQALAGWHGEPTGGVATSYGWASWVLTAFAALAAGWGVRDGLNVVQRARVA